MQNVAYFMVWLETHLWIVFFSTIAAYVALSYFLSEFRDHRYIKLLKESTDDANKKVSRAVEYFGSRGYQVRSRAETQVQLVKPKDFSFIFALLWFCVFGVGLVIYLIYYMAKRDKVITLTF